MARTKASSKSASNKMASTLKQVKAEEYDLSNAPMEDVQPTSEAKGSRSVAYGEGIDLDSGKAPAQSTRSRRKLLNEGPPGLPSRSVRAGSKSGEGVFAGSVKGSEASSHIPHPASLYRGRRSPSPVKRPLSPPPLRHASYSQAVVVGSDGGSGEDTLSSLSDASMSDGDEVDKAGNLVGFIDDEADDGSVGGTPPALDSDVEAVAQDERERRGAASADCESDSDGADAVSTAGEVTQRGHPGRSVQIAPLDARSSRSSKHVGQVEIGAARRDRLRARNTVLAGPRALVPPADGASVLKMKRARTEPDRGAGIMIIGSALGDVVESDEGTNFDSCAEVEYTVPDPPPPVNAKGKARADPPKDSKGQALGAVPAEKLLEFRAQTMSAAAGPSGSGGKRAKNAKSSGVEAGSSAGRQGGGTTPVVRRPRAPPTRPSTPSNWSPTPVPKGPRRALSVSSMDEGTDAEGPGVVGEVPDFGMDVEDADGGLPLNSPVDNDLSDGPIQDAWLKDQYAVLPALPAAEAIPVYPQDSLPSELALMPSAVKDRYDGVPGLAHVSGCLYRVLNLTTAAKVYVNPCRCDVNAVVPSKYGTSMYLTIPRSIVPTRKGGLAVNACFFMTGPVAYSNLGVPATRCYKEVVTTDRRIGMYPFEFEYQRAFHFFAAVSTKSPLRYPFASGVLAFTTRNEGSGESSQNFGPSSKRSDFHPQSQPQAPAGSAPSVALQHIQSARFPPALNFTDPIPILDARRRVAADGPLDFSNLASLPVYPRADVNESAIVTVGFTANTYVNKTGSNRGLDYLSLNLQFVIVHAESPTRRIAIGDRV